ncbi:hypothetical protein AQPE_3992 [Aquipluma nitroreducens]|uniref:Outer membrane protein beta-barrel domain-containing protein n=1 Tax=Aquipluma nitroreducens TaxID=2010828 RepID=A0A5K7SEX9_9BACT|nr:hypothetical protein [Aquipluma nitroreducens]BBE19804.1 hypothetical protein AQPE_3992 [Aquipluma nitroreducens]
MNRNIEDIDQLFREGLNPEDDRLAYQEADWLELKKRLDRNAQKRRGVFWLIRLSGVAALILLFFAIRTLLPESQNRIVQQAEVQQNDQKQQQKQAQPIVSPEVRKDVRKAESVSGTLLAQNKPLEKQLPKKLPIHQASENEINNGDTILVNNLNISNTKPEQKVHRADQATSQPDAVKPVEQKRPATDESLFAPNEKPNEIPEPEHLAHKLTLSVLAAPDYNGVNNLNNASIGDNFGLLVTFKIAKNWSFSTGGVYAKKLYETGFGNYSPSKNIWDEYYPKSVYADCRVLDIPLNISYSLVFGKNTTISFGTGISSYIMLREDYRFSYEEQDSNTAVAYHVVNENQHWLSVLNFQATFERRINSKVSIGLQPYMKIPMSKIGFAGVKLQSLGMAVVLNWNFN